MPGDDAAGRPSETEVASHDAISAFVDPVVEDAADLCSKHDHITRVLGDIEFPVKELTDRYNENDTPFTFDSIICLFLYQEVCEYSYAETSRRVRNWPYLLIRFGLHHGPSKPGVSKMWKRRLTVRGRLAITEAADRIREIVADHDLIDAPDEAPPIDPTELGEGDTGLTESEIRRIVQLARKQAFAPFESGRAANAKYSDPVFWEHHAYQCLVRCGTTRTNRRFPRLSWRGSTPHGDTHTRTIKKTATPDPQTELAEFVAPSEFQTWKRIRKTVIEPFDEAVENILAQNEPEEVIREPVNVAIDITPWEFYPSPWKYRDLDIVKDDYPTLVNGLKEKHSRGYKFATLTIIGRNTPIVLAIEPVKNASKWEPDDAESMSYGEVVERLLEKAERHVDIHKVMADSAFDAEAVWDVIDRKGMTYLIPRRHYTQEVEDIEDIKSKPNVTGGVRRHIPREHEGREHEASTLYVPTDKKNGWYKAFATNRDVKPDGIASLAATYRDRWEIENEYKVFKDEFLPQTCSTDYRMRLFQFVAAALFYNVWRLAGVILRTMTDVEFGDSPPLAAGGVTEIMVACRDTGIG